MLQGGSLAERLTHKPRLAANPVQLSYFQSACRLWSSLKAEPTFLMRVLRSDIVMYKCDNDMAWAGHLIKQAHLLGLFPDIERRELHTLSQDSLLGRSFHVPSVTKHVTERYEALWQIEVNGSPYVDRSDVSTESAHRFANFVYMPDKEGHLTYHGPSQLVSSLHLFRLGSAGLRAGLHSDNPDDRQCPHCRGGVVEDEQHVIQHCPAYSPLRA